MIQYYLSINYSVIEFNCQVFSNFRQRTNVYFRLCKFITKMNKNSEFQQNQSTVDIKKTLIEQEMIFCFQSASQDLMDVFQKTALELNFELIEREKNECTIIKKPLNSISQYINCFGLISHEHLTAVKLEILHNQPKNSMKEQTVAKIKGLVGSKSHINRLINKFTTNFSKIQSIEFSTPNLIFDQHETTISDIESENPFNLEVNCFNIVNRLIISEEFQISKLTEKMISDYGSTFKNLRESLTLVPLPIKKALSIATEIQGELLKLVRKLKYPNEIELFLKICSEQFVFSKVESQIYSIYRLKNLDTENKFNKKKEQILARYTVKQILNEVCLDDKFWSVQKSKIDSYIKQKEDKKLIHFGSACRQLEKLVFTSNPREKLKHCQMTYSTLKTHFYDYSKGKYELTSMEDIIPIMIVIILLSNVNDLRTQFDIMSDFISNDRTEMEDEKRLLINLSESYNYIWRDWNIKK